MLDEWRLRAACRGLGPDIFFVEREEGQDNSGAEAKAICVTCEVSIECLSYAVRAGEPTGIWGGIGQDRRFRIRAIYNRGDVLGFERALIYEVESLQRDFAVIEDERPYRPEMDCTHCDGRVAPGRHPEDRNGENATCGLASTYNKGCRCGRCIDGKSDYEKERRARRKSPSPRGGRAGVSCRGKTAPKEYDR